MRLLVRTYSSIDILISCNFQRAIYTHQTIQKLNCFTSFPYRVTNWVVSTVWMPFNKRDNSPWGINHRYKSIIMIAHFIQCLSKVQEYLPDSLSLFVKIKDNFYINN